MSGTGHVCYTWGASFPGGLDRGRHPCGVSCGFEAILERLVCFLQNVIYVQKQVAAPAPTSDSTVARLNTLLKKDSDREAGASVQKSGSQNCDSPTIDESSVQATASVADIPAAASDPDQAGQRVAVTAFQAAVSEAQQEAERQLAAIVERVRRAAAEQHTADIFQITGRHAEELRQIRETVETEVTERVRQEETTRHAAELARMSAELERQHADDLQRARSAAVDSFKALTSSIMQRSV